MRSERESSIYPVRSGSACRTFAVLSILAFGAAITLGVLSSNRTSFTPAGPGILKPIRSVVDANRHTASKTSFPGGAVEDWWGHVQEALAEAEYHPSENGQGLQAPNRAHNLRVYFGRTGIRLHDRTVPGSPELAGFSLVGMGRGAELAAVAAGTVMHAGTRVEIQRPGVIEWYKNSSLGLEQGFTLAAPMKGEGPIVLELAVEHAKASLRGQSIELATDTGRRLTYGKLIARDANGMILAARLAVPSPQRVQLIVEDSGAAYPVVIDPLDHRGRRRFAGVEPAGDHLF